MSVNTRAVLTSMKNEASQEFNDWYRIRKWKLHCVIKPKHPYTIYILFKA